MVLFLELFLNVLPSEEKTISGYADLQSTSLWPFSAYLTAGAVNYTIVHLCFYIELQISNCDYILLFQNILHFNLQEDSSLAKGGVEDGLLFDRVFGLLDEDTSADSELLLGKLLHSCLREECLSVDEDALVLIRNYLLVCRQVRRLPHSMLYLDNLSLNINIL